jgi:glucosamine-6-phosphate deaminase
LDPYALPFEQFAKLKPWRFSRAADTIALNRKIAAEVVAELQRAMRENRRLMVICPVGPLDYSYWAEEMNQAQTDGSSLITVNMDEYLNERDEFIEESHPLSFRRFMHENFFMRLQGHARLPVANIHFPSPKALESTTKMIEDHGGADLCYGGMGLTGHFAFNDPPPAETDCDDREIAGSRTRTLTICPETQAQMCMGGTGGNWSIIPKRAVTLGMYELLMSKKIHLTFMRSWHAGVLRRALFGEVSGRCPGSFVQHHPNVEVTMTELAAALPLIHVAQRIAE